MPLAETDVHVGSRRDAHVAECVSQQKRTCTSASEEKAERLHPDKLRVQPFGGSAPARAFNLYGNGRAGNLSGGAERHVQGLRSTTIADEGDLDSTPGRIEPSRSNQPICRRRVKIVDLGHHVAGAQARLVSWAAADNLTESNSGRGGQL